jgi:hypothetical protein
MENARDELKKELEVAKQMAAEQRGQLEAVKKTAADEMEHVEAQLEQLRAVLAKREEETHQVQTSNR